MKVKAGEDEYEFEFCTVKDYLDQSIVAGNDQLYFSDLLILKCLTNPKYTFEQLSNLKAKEYNRLALAFKTAIDKSKEDVSKTYNVCEITRRQLGAARNFAEDEGQSDNSIYITAMCVMQSIEPILTKQEFLQLPVNQFLILRDKFNKINNESKVNFTIA